MSHCICCTPLNCDLAVIHPLSHEQAFGLMTYSLKWDAQIIRYSVESSGGETMDAGHREPRVTSTGLEEEVWPCSKVCKTSSLLCKASPSWFVTELWRDPETLKAHILHCALNSQAGSTVFRCMDPDVQNTLTLYQQGLVNLLGAPIGPAKISLRPAPPHFFSVHCVSCPL